MAAEPFLDTNVLVRHLTGDHPTHSPRATAYLQRVEQGEQRARLTDIVIFETVYLLERTYRQPKAAIAAALLPLLEMPALILPGKRKFRQVFDLYVTLNLPFADAYMAVVMRQLGLSAIISFDRDFDRVPGISRKEP
jgi:predicted nucleic acid-binding protein